MKTVGQACSMVTLVISIVLIGACSSESESDAPPIQSWRAAPVDTWVYFEGPEVTELAAFLEGLNPTDIWSEENASEWKVAFLESLPAGSWTLGIGLSPVTDLNQEGFTPVFITSDGSMSWSHECLSGSGCSGCSNVATPDGAVPAVPQNTFKNICATVSTAYSLSFVLGKREPYHPQIPTVEKKEKQQGGQKVTKEYWKKGFLSTIREEQEHDPNSGTPRDKIKKAYELYSCTCTDETSIASVGDISKWRDQLKSEIEGEPRADCHLIMTGPNSAHDVNVDNIKDDGSIEVYDTGAQGSGSGEDVPVLKQSQVWTLGGTAANPSIQCTDTQSGTKDFWNGQGFNRASYICCECPQGGGGS